MKKYLSIFKMRFMVGIQYRAAAWGGISTQFFWGFMYIMIYSAFYQSAISPPPMTWSELVPYIWLQQSFLSLTMLWWQDNELLSAISSGHVAYELARPYNLYLFWYMRLLAVRLSNLTLRCLPVLSISLILPKAYRMLPPAGTSEGFLFVLSMSLSLLLVTALSMFIYILTFVTLTSVGSRLLIAVTAEFLMGSVIPIPFMPDTLQKVLNYLPFRYLADLPLRLYSGNIASIDATRQISVQVLWIITLWITGYISFQKVLKRVIIQGG